MSTLMEEEKYNTDEYQQPQLAQTRLSATLPASSLDSTAAVDHTSTRSSSTHPKVDEVGFNDSAWFVPQKEQHYRRPRGPPTSSLHAPPPAWTMNDASIETIPSGLVNVDGSLSEREALAREKQAFIENWKRQQGIAIGVPANQLQQMYPIEPPTRQPAVNKSKVEFRPLPVDHATGPAFNYFPDDSPPAPDSIPANVTTTDILARSVEFIPLSTAAGQSAGGGGLWNRMSTWSKIQFNREGLKLEDGRNAKGTAEQVLYTIWKQAQDKLPQSKLTPQPSAPVYKQKQPDGTILKTSNPPTTGVQAPPKPLPSNFIKHKTDKVRERNAMSLQDWNVLSTHDETILNPYDPIQRAKKDELLRSRRNNPNATGLYAHLTKQEKQTRLNIERERMVYEDCNARGAVRKSSYRFIPKVNNRKMYSTSWGPVSFGAGAPFGSATFAPYPMGGPQLTGGGMDWTTLAMTPQEAWKIHHSNLSRERNAMGREDIDAKTGLRHVAPQNEWQERKAKRTKQAMEKAAMSKNDKNVISSGSGFHAGIYTTHLGPFQYSSNRGKTYQLVKLPKVVYNLCPHVWGDLVNRHPLAKHKEGIRYYKRTNESMRGILVLNEDQSTNVNDAYALDGLDQAKNKVDAKTLNAAEALFSQTTYASMTLSHGQAYSQRSRLRYRYIDAPGYAGPPAVLPLGATYPTVPAPEPIQLDRHHRPIKKHRPASKPSPTTLDQTGTINVNNSYTFIPRWNEPDAPFDPKVRTVNVYSSVGQPPFLFDDSKPYIFDRTTPYDPTKHAPNSIHSIFGSYQADIAALPFSAPKRLFRRSRLHDKIHQRIVRDQKIEQTRLEALEGAAIKPKWKFLSQKYAKEQAEFEAMLEAQRKLQPWDHTISLNAFGQVHGRFGSSLLQKPGDVFYSPIGSSLAFNTFGTGAFAPAASTPSPFSPTSATAASTSTSKSLPVPATLTTLPSFDGTGASTFTIPPPLSTSSDPTAALAAAFEANLSLNPFRSPDQLTVTQEYLSREHAARSAQLEQQRVAKEAKKKEREETKQKKRQAKDLGQGFTDVDANGQVHVFKTTNFDFTSPKQSSNASILTSPKFPTQSSLSASPNPYQFTSFDPPSSTQVTDYRHPVFGRSTNPYSPSKAFQKWNAWNEKYELEKRMAAANQPTNEYVFRPMPFTRAQDETSSEDDSNDEQESKYDYHRSSQSATPSSGTRQHHKRKENEPFSGGPVTVSFRDQIIDTRPRSRSASRTRERSTSRTRSSHRQPLKSSLKSSTTPLFSSEATRASRPRARSKSRDRHGSRSPSPDDPFEWHAQRRSVAQPNPDADPTRFPAHRSSQPFMSEYDRPQATQYLSSNTTTMVYDPHGHQHRHHAHHRSTEQQQQQSQYDASPSQFNARVTPSVFQQSNYSNRYGSSAASSTSTIPPPASLSHFHTGYSTDSVIAPTGFRPWTADLDPAHSNHGAYAVASTLSSSPTKRQKAIRRDRGSKRTDWEDDQRRTDADELEWQAAQDRWKYDQQTQTTNLSLRTRHPRQRVDDQLNESVDDEAEEYLPPTSIPSATTRSNYAEHSRRYGGDVYVNIHSPVPIHAIGTGSTSAVVPSAPPPVSIPSTGSSVADSPIVQHFKEEHAARELRRTEPIIERLEPIAIDSPTRTTTTITDEFKEA